jgi:hypothetical protein
MIPKKKKQTPFGDFLTDLAEDTYYNKLDWKETREFDKNLNDVIDSVKGVQPLAQFSKDMALELLGKIAFADVATRKLGKGWWKDA